MNIPYTKGAGMLDDRESRLQGLPRLHTGPMRVVGQKGVEKKPWNARQWLKEHASRDFRPVTHKKEAKPPAGAA